MTSNSLNFSANAHNADNQPQMNTDKHRFKVRISKSIRVYLWLSLALVLVGCKPEAQKKISTDRLTVEYSIDRETIYVGDPVELIVTAYFPSNGVLELPELGREKDLVLLNRDWTREPRENGLIKSETLFTLTSFRLGEHVVSTNTISCEIGDETFITNFPKIVLQVESSLTDDASSEIADIKPMHKLHGRVPPWLWMSLLVALVAFLIGLITSKLWKNRQTLIPSAPPIPPHIIAFQSLEGLKKKGLLEKDECNPFYTELSLILRTYLEGRFHLNAPDETTEEIVGELSISTELDGNQRNILQEFMRQADMVKFAKGHPDRTTMESAFTTTTQFVEETKQTDLTPKT
jgi:hypothetical protein